MPPILTDDFEPSRSIGRVLADLAIGLALVAAVALITSFVAATSAPL